MWYSSGSCDNLVLIENNGLISASFAPAALTKESIMPPIRNDWAKVLAPEYNKPYYRIFRLSRKHQGLLKKHQGLYAKHFRLF